LTAIAGSITPVRAQAANPNVLQTLTVFLEGNPLPPSTGQILDRASADAVIAANVAAAPGQRLVVNPDNSITDPVSGMTILQGYVPADPFYDTPPHPMCGGVPPAQPTIAASTWGLGTFKPFIWGQSHASNAGRGRYTATGANLAWVGCYGGGGKYYPCSDPLVLASDSDGNVWSRVADMVAGKPINGTMINRVVLGGCPVGGTSINDWAPSGSEHARLISALTDYMNTVGMPTHLCFDQGDADALSMTTAQWFARFQAMLNAVRGIGCTSPIWVTISTVCNFRDAANPAPNEASSRTGADLIAREVGRQKIRAAQAMAQSINGNTHAGPNNDLIEWRLRAYGDGCHFGELGLAAHAKAWVAALFGP